MIRILGGEPLLNPEINHYIRLSRALYPQAEIYVVTNGILLPQMPDDFFATLKNADAGVHISAYPPMLGKLEEIQRLLLMKEIKFQVIHTHGQFTMKQTLKKHDRANETFLKCRQAHCHNLYDGKVAACFLPFTTKYFNEYFDRHLPEDGAIDLYKSDMSTRKLKQQMMKPFDRCCYCTEPQTVNWEQIQSPSVLSDWVYDSESVTTNSQGM